MKLKSTALLLALSLSAHAQSTTSTSQYQPENTDLKNITMEIGVNAINSLKSETAEDSDISGRGFNFGFGKVINLQNNLISTTSLKVNYNSLDYEDELVDYRTYDIGIEQRVAMRIPLAGNLNLIPFVEGGISRGNLNAKSLTAVGTSSGTNLNSIELDNSFTRLSASAGLTFEYTRLLPFIKYTYSKLLMSNSGTISTSLNGSPVLNEAEFDGGLLEDLDASTVTVGIGFLF